MKRAELEQMGVDKLWKLHGEISDILAVKIVAEKEVLDNRLSRLQTKSLPEPETRASERRPYPRVFPKFRNPDDPSETWAGRGKQPRWLTAHLRSGRRVDDFRIC
jgi:DNA-binding protein H-NS